MVQLADRAGSKIRSARWALSLTLEDVSDETGVSPTYLSEIERGRKTRVDVRKLDDLAAVLRLPLGALTADCRTASVVRLRRPPPPLTTPERDQIVQVWARIPRAHRAPWVAVLERAGE